MTDINNQIIQCPKCKTSITVDKLGEHVNANPEIKKQAIAEQLERWGEAYDLEYLMQNVVFCPRCHKVSHLRTGLIVLARNDNPFPVNYFTTTNSISSSIIRKQQQQQFRKLSLGINFILAQASLRKFRNCSA